MDFGGLGLKAEYMLFKYVGPFVGLGYNFYGLGLNGGVIAKPFADKNFTPYVLAMGGNTRVVVIRGAAHLNRIDYGLSLGGGFELKTKNNNVFQFGLVLPFRSQGFRDHYEQLQNNPIIDFDNNLSPVALTTSKLVFKTHVVFSHPTSISSHFSVVLRNFLTFVH